MLTLWIARDKDDTLTIFEKKPTKNMGSWTSKGGSNHEMFINEDLFKEIKWEDAEPKKLLCEAK